MTYAKDPNSHTNVVLDWYSLAIGTWLYPKKLSVNEKNSCPMTSLMISLTKGVGKGYVSLLY